MIFKNLQTLAMTFSVVSLLALSSVSSVQAGNSTIQATTPASPANGIGGATSSNNSNSASAAETPVVTAPTTPAPTEEVRTSSSNSLIFKTPSDMNNGTSKLEYKAEMALDQAPLWKIIDKTDQGFTPYRIEKDSSNYVTVLETNQKPNATIGVAYESLDVIKINDTLSRITIAPGRFAYIPTANISENVAITQKDIDDKTVIGSDNKAAMVKQYPYVIRYAFNSSDATFELPKYFQATATTNSEASQKEADALIAGSTFDNSTYVLDAPVAKQNTAVFEAKASTVNNSESVKYLPWVAAASVFALANAGIYLVFAKKLKRD
jgi:hypothetical protein